MCLDDKSENPASNPPQDAHEFLNFLLNSCCDILEKEQREQSTLPPPPPGSRPPPPRTFVHEIFQARLGNAQEVFPFSLSSHASARGLASRG